MSGTTTVLAQERAERIRVRGLVQGVGFRPTVWRLAQRYGLRGWVTNDGDGVDIRISGGAAEVEAFVFALAHEAPPLARVDRIERETSAAIDGADFRILGSTAAGAIHTGVVPDAAACAACVQEVFDPFARRFRYPFTNCTHCGPRLSIIEAIPYDRAATTMRRFALCAACAAEYANAGDRRFHAQPIACFACGPRATLARVDGAAVALETFTMLDAPDAACTLLQRGEIVMVKGLGGYQLACDATNAAAVTQLRARKRREGKPFALMARDLDVIARYCAVSPQDQALLSSAAAPIVLMDAEGAASVASEVAPGLRTLGFMLPSTPLHHLLLRRMNRPIVLTSGNLADEPQCIGADEARTRLAPIATWILEHDRPIARRVDDSVVRVMAGAPRVQRRARGYAPAPLPLPAGFERSPKVLALGGELKNTFCLLRDGQAIVSHHLGDLADVRTHADYRQALDDYAQLFDYAPNALAVDAHPEYLSTKLGAERAQRDGLRCESVQHHHAHIAACLVDNAVALDTGPVIGVALDGLGYGDDGTFWGGEFLLADYVGYRRVGTFKPVALLGGELAMREPWRNTYAHLMAELGWPRFAMNFADLELHAFLAAKPRVLLDAMLQRNLNSPLASSCGRLFDAVAAAAGIERERVTYEGQAAVVFEALADGATVRDCAEESAYPFSIPRLKETGLPYIEPLAMWQALLGDLILATPVPVIAARFHKGLAAVIAKMVRKIAQHHADAAPLQTVALSGGVFQNKLLLELVSRQLQGAGFRVLMHRQVPSNDGGLALGQAAVVAARLLAQA